MAQPITWQNVNGPSLADAAAPMRYASQMFGAGFDGLQKELDKRQLTTDKNWEQGKVNNTNDALNTINGYDSPEAYAAAQKSGVIQSLLTANGAQMDQAAVRSAADSRLSTLQKRGTDAINYTNTVADSVAAPIIESYKVAALRGDKTTMASIEAAHPDMRGMSAGMDFGHTAIRRPVLETQTDAKSAADLLTLADSHLKAPLERQRLQAEMETARAQQENLRAQARMHDAQAADMSAPDGISAKSKDAALQKLIANSPLDKGDMSTTAGKEKFMAELAKVVPDKAQREDILYNFTQQFSEGVKIGKDANGKDIRTPLPVSVALDEAMGSTDNLFAQNWAGWSRRGDDWANNVETRFRTDKTLLSQIQAIREAQGTALAPLSSTGRVDTPSALDAALAARSAKKKVKQ